MRTIASQLARAGVNLGSMVAVPVTWAVCCDQDQVCRWALLRLPSLAAAREAARQHIASHPTHVVSVVVDVTLPVAGGEALRDSRRLADSPSSDPSSPVSASPRGSSPVSEEIEGLSGRMTDADNRAQGIHPPVQPLRGEPS